MIKKLLKKTFNSLGIKGWSFSDNSTAFPVAANPVMIDPITSQLIYSNNYTLLSQKAYIENVISNRCIKDTARAVNDIPFDIFIDDNNVVDSSDRLAKAFIKLVADPNQDDDWCFLIETIMGSRMLGGRAYVWPQLSSMGEPMDIQSLRPDRVTPQQSAGERILSYRYSRGSFFEVFTRDDEGRFDLIDWRQYNPISDVQGLSNVSPAALSIEGHTSGNKWNKQQLDNGHRDTGILTIDGEENSGYLDEEQLNALQEKLQRNTAHRYGVKIINAPATYTALDLTPTEMDFISSIKAKAIEICNGFNYPPYLLGLDGATFNNQAEAKLALYEQSAIPMAKEFYRILGDYYTRKIGRKIVFKLKLREVVALAPRFKTMHEEVRADWDTDLITRNEARDAIGYEELSGLDGDVYKSDLKAPVNFNTPS